MSPDVLNLDIVSALLCGCVFRFERGDGSVIAQRLRLRADGTIEGVRHPDESKWGVQVAGAEIVLNFYAADGRLSASFRKAPDAPGGALTMAGPFLLSRGDIIHRLVSLPDLPAAVALPVHAPAKATSPQNSVAVFVRTHLCDEKYVSLMRKLSAHRSGFDLFALVDETRGRPDPGPWPVVWHSLGLLAQMGLTQRHGVLLYRCGDMPLYVAMREQPKYAHYVMIEDDVELCGEDAGPVNELCRALSDGAGAPLDFVGVIFRPDRTQVWGRTSWDVYGAENAHLARFPMVVFSKRLCAYLYSQRLIEAVRNPEPADVMHCEVFAASAAVAGGFVCADLNAVMAGCYDRSIMMIETPGFGLPMGAGFVAAPAIKFYHPVYETTSWLRRTKALLLQPGKRTAQRLINLTKRVNEARARDDKVLVEAVEQLALELGPDLGGQLMGPYRECRLEAPEVGDDETWREARRSIPA